MERGISKEELVWLVTRVVGAVFLWLAITKLGAVIGLFYSSKQMDGMGMGLSERMVSVALKPLVFSLVTYMFLAFYFLKRGSGFVSMVSTMGEVRERKVMRSSPEGFEAWLQADATHSTFPYEKQLAMYEAWRLENF